MAKEISEEILSSDEKQVVSQHLEHCRECRDFVRLTSRFPLLDDSPTEEEINAAVSDVIGIVHRQRRELSQQRSLRTTFALVGAIAAAALIALSVLFLAPDESSEVPVASECAPVAPVEVVPGVFMTYCEHREPGTIIENGGEVRVALRDGTVGLLINPDRPTKKNVTVETPLGKVRVKGTVFTVHVDQENARVEVFRGIVEVIPTAGDAPFRVTAGHGTEMRHRTTYTLGDPKTDLLRQRLAEKRAEVETDRLVSRNGAADGMLTEETPSPAAPDQAPALTEDVGTAESASPSSRRHAHGAARRNGPTIDTLIQDAQSCLIVRDWRCAESKYQEVLRRYSGRPESMAVLISLAKIQLRHLNAPKSALAHYKTYQRRAPNGPLAEEALFGIASAYRYLRLTDKEAETLRRFVSQYPGSAHAKKAQSRLETLERGQVR